MQFARRHRRKIMVLISLFALGAMTFGYLRRIGIDPFGGQDEQEQAQQAER